MLTDSSDAIISLIISDSAVFFLLAEFETRADDSTPISYSSYSDMPKVPLSFLKLKFFYLLYLGLWFLDGASLKSSGIFTKLSNV